MNVGYTPWPVMDLRFRLRRAERRLAAAEAVVERARLLVTAPTPTSRAALLEELERFDTSRGALERPFPGGWRYTPPATSGEVESPPGAKTPVRRTKPTTRRAGITRPPIGTRRHEASIL